LKKTTIAAIFGQQKADVSRTEEEAMAETLMSAEFDARCAWWGQVFILGLFRLGNEFRASLMMRYTALLYSILNGRAITG